MKGKSKAASWGGCDPGEYGFKLVNSAVAAPDELEAPCRSFSSNASAVLVPLTEERQLAEAKTKSERRNMKRALEHERAMRELEASEAEAKTAAARLAAAREAVQEVENELKGDSENG